MSNRLDQLFKDKLADHAITPSADAWGRVRGNLSRKNRVPFFLRLAAAILLLCAATAMIVWWSYVNSSVQTPTLSKENTVKPETPKKKVEDVQPLNLQRSMATHVVRHMPAPKAAKQATPSPAETNKEPLRDETLPESSFCPVTPVVITGTEVPEKPIVLEYRLESIQRPAVAAVESKEKSGFKKVIDFALEAKHSDGPVGLRQAKDELFALNFIKDKQKNHK